MAKTIQTQVRLTKIERDILSSLGHGDMTAGLRFLLQGKILDTMRNLEHENICSRLDKIEDKLERLINKE